MFENPRRGRKARNFTTNAPKILGLKSSSEQIFSRKLPLGAPASLINGMFQINQEFHMTDSEGGTLLEDHVSFTAPRILARIALSEAHSAHSAILENTRQEFMELSLQPSSK